MDTTTEPSRLQLDLREETWAVPGRTVATWGSATSRHASTPAVYSHAALAECICPMDCIRDHETD